MDDHNRRQRLRFRSWHRGTNEMDLLMGRFADAHMAAFTDSQLDQYEAILNLNDPDVFHWVAGIDQVPQEHDTEVMRLLVAYRHTFNVAP